MQLNVQVLEGIVQHTSVHAESSRRMTALPVASEKLGIVGVIDVAEPLEDGTYRIVEHKRGSTHQWDNDQLQVTAQAIAFEETTEMTATSGSVFSWTSRRRYEFEITETLHYQVEQVVADMHATIDAGYRPTPTPKKQKCRGCSLREVCQPTLIRKKGQTR